MAVLLAILRGLPRLDGAACVGRADLFDPAVEDEHPDAVSYRHLAAQKVCRYACPVLAECQQWAETEKSHGSVLAGLIPKSTRLPRDEVA